METSILEKRIIARFGNQKAFAKASGIPASTLSRLLKGESEWGEDRMIVAIDLLKIPPKEIPAYFFACRTPKTEHL